MAQVTQYQLDDATTVSFEYDPPPGFHAASAHDVVGQVRAAVQPAIEAAEIVLQRVKTAKPTKVEVKFGLKVSGTASWFVAKAATEGNFEVTLAWELPVGEKTDPDEK